MVWLQSATGSITYANTRWFELTQLPRHPSSFEAEAWKQVIHPDDYGRALEALADAISTEAAFSVEYRLRPAMRGDDEYRWYFASATPKYLDGLFDGWVGSIVDIQEARNREEAERRLREVATRRENEFKALGEALPQIAWTADASGSIDWYNHRWYDYTGQSQSEAFGWGWQDVHHPDDFPGMMKQWTDAIEAGEKVEMEFRLKGRDGRFRWFLTLINPLKDEHGRVLRWFGTNTDINEQKETLERSKRMAQTLQEAFLPEHLPKTADVALDALYSPAISDAFVGGDWYDAFRKDERILVISIGDVAGHGLDAAVVAGRLRQTIFSEALRTDDPCIVLANVDRVLRAQSDTIATALVAYVDVKRGTMTFASAGHPAPLVASRDGSATFLPDGSAPLGTGFICGGLIPLKHEHILTTDSTIVFYTDGIIEFDRNVLAGQAKLLSVVEAAVRSGTAISAQDIFDRVLAGKSTSDDVAVVVMRWKSSLPVATPKEALTKELDERFSRAFGLEASSSQFGRAVESARLAAHNQNSNLRYGPILKVRAHSPTVE